MKPSKQWGDKPPRAGFMDNDDWEDEDDEVEIETEEAVDMDVLPGLMAKDGRDKLAVRRRIEQYWEERRLRELLGDDLDE